MTGRRTGATSGAHARAGVETGDDQYFAGLREEFHPVRCWCSRCSGARTVTTTRSLALATARCAAGLQKAMHAHWVHLQGWSSRRNAAVVEGVRAAAGREWDGTEAVQGVESTTVWAESARQLALVAVDGVVAVSGEQIQTLKC